MRNRHDLPCPMCGGSSSCSFYPLDKPHLYCHKCEKSYYNLTEEEIEIYTKMDNNLIKLQAYNTESKGNNLKMDRTGLFPQRGIICDLVDRGIRKDVAEKFSIETLFDDDDKPYARSFPAFKDTSIIAQKIKRLDKKMKWLYEGMSLPNDLPLFGQNLFPSGGKFITITEGEEDCLAAYQMLKDASPAFEPVVVSLNNGAANAEKECKVNWEYINSFENIILAFDGDEPGQKATEKVCRLFDYKPKVLLFSDIKKIKYTDEQGVEHSKWENKDSNDYLKNKKEKDFVRMWWKAEKVNPKGVLSFGSLWDAMTKKDQDLIVDFPWDGLNKTLHGLRTGRFYIIKAPPKIGKCFGKDTPIRMYDGSIKMVQDIIVKDQLMGDDGKPRNVESIVTGIEDLYRINQTKRDSYIVNKSHILCLKSTDTKEKIDLSLEEYLAYPYNKAIRLKGYSSPILREEPCNLNGIPPYILGAWLGDGTEKAPEFTNINEEVIAEIRNFAKTIGAELSYKDDKSFWLKHSTKEDKPFIQILRELGVLGNKHIPCSGMLLSPMKDRLELLAGLIDTDGYYARSGNNTGVFEIIQKRKELAYQILDLARSCGFGATIKSCIKSCMYKGEKISNVYWRINIFGEIEKIPVRIEYKKAIVNERRRDGTVCGLDIEPIGEDKYFGFVLDGNHRFLLADGTVVHNTQIMRELVYQVRTKSTYNAGLIFLEDTKKSIGLGMCALHMNKPIQFPDVSIDMQELQKAHEFMSEENRLVVFDPEVERTVDNVINKMLYFIKAHDCRFIFLDHISMLTYTSGDNDERRFLDKLVADLKTLTNKHNICIVSIIHVNDEGKTRGSRAPVQLCDGLISLERDKLNKDPIIANTTSLIVEENRLTGESGLACKLFFDRKTGRMLEMDLDTEIEQRKVEFDD